jgi:hypothetical protein
MPDHLSKEQIEHYLERQIAPADLPEIDDHISQCADCRDRVSSAGDLRAALRRERVQRLGSTSPEPLGRKEHLSYEQFEAYVEGRSSRSERELVRKHAESCRICADELRDLDDFKTELSGTVGTRSWNLKAWWEEFAPFWLTLPRLALALAASAAIVVVISLTRLASPPFVPLVQNTKPAPSGENSRDADAHGLMAGLDARVPEIDTLPAEEQRAILDAFSERRIKPANVLTELQGKTETLLGQTAGFSRFEVLTPVGEVVLDARPVFRWQPVAEAKNYKVAIFDAQLNQVQSSGPLRVTEWRPKLPLERGRLYVWQVNAQLGDGGSVSAPTPPSPEAKFTILDQRKVNEIALFQQNHRESHVVLGILYGQAGLLEKGEYELEQVPKGDPNYEIAQNLLESIKDIRHPPH